eukprot:730532-Pelagomonas_calceolata.AAC.2
MAALLQAAQATPLWELLTVVKWLGPVSCLFVMDVKFSGSWCGFWNMSAVAKQHEAVAKQRGHHVCVSTARVNEAKCVRSNACMMNEDTARVRSNTAVMN